jgi:hypothetical protein
MPIGGLTDPHLPPTIVHTHKQPSAFRISKSEFTDSLNLHLNSNLPSDISSPAIPRLPSPAFRLPIPDP